MGKKNHGPGRWHNYLTRHLHGQPGTRMDSNDFPNLPSFMEASEDHRRRRKKGTSSKLGPPMCRNFDPADYHMDEFGPGPDNTNYVWGTIQVAAMVGIIAYGVSEFREHQYPKILAARGQQTQGETKSDLPQADPVNIVKTSVDEGNYWVEIPDTDPPLHPGGYQLVEKGNQMYAKHGNNIYALKIVVPQGGSTINGILLQYGLGDNNLPEDSPLVEFIRTMNSDAGRWGWRMLRHDEPTLFPFRMATEDEVKGAAPLSKNDLPTRVDRMITGNYL